MKIRHSWKILSLKTEVPFIAHPMFDCPEQNQTSPKDTSSKVNIVIKPVISILQTSPDSIGSKWTIQLLVEESYKVEMKSPYLAIWELSS